jgi:hypothetical protein
MPEDWSDEFDDDELDDELGDAQEAAAAEPELTAEASGAAEAEARYAAVAKQDELIRELNSESDEPPVGPQTGEQLEAWGQVVGVGACGTAGRAGADRRRVRALGR